MAGKHSFKRISPGGLAAVGTNLDPFLTKSDSLTGRMVGLVGKVPPVIFSLAVNVHLLKRVVGFEEDIGVEPIRVKESIMITAGTANTVGLVTNVKGDQAEITLKYPISANIGQRIALGRRISNRWRLVGYGEIASIQ